MTLKLLKTIYSQLITLWRNYILSFIVSLLILGLYALLTMSITYIVNPTIIPLKTIFIESSEEIDIEEEYELTEINPLLTYSEDMECVVSDIIYAPNDVFNVELCPNYTGIEVMEFYVPNELFGIYSFLAGDYPKENEILLDELTASEAIKKLNLTSYNDLVGKTLKMSNNGENNYKISGVYKGNGPVLLGGKYDTLKSTTYSYMINFDTIFEKKKFIEQNNYRILHQYDFRDNQYNIKKLISILCIILTSYIYWLIIFDTKQKLFLKIYIHYKLYGQVFYSLLIPIFVYAILILLFLKVL